MTRGTGISSDKLQNTPDWDSVRASEILTTVVGGP